MTNPVVASRISKSPSAGRKALLLSCASAALAAGVVAPQKARAQAFDGGIVSDSGNVARGNFGTGTETITVSGPSATINWSPNNGGSGNIVFLQEGNVATFQGDSGVTDYTVLNRIVPTDATRAIELNGSVLSKVDGGATGGKIWFYSPGGIVVGANSVFDVGGLLLSTVNIPDGPSVDGDNFFASFAVTELTAPGKIEIKPGASIQALTQNAYIGLVAPRIEQGGNVRVNGSAAYVAAEGLSMSFNQGLFDITVDVGAGTSDGNGIVHTGTTRGNSVNGNDDGRAIYMVAVPKNEALTMLLSGDIGYTDASNAVVDNGTIILSAGHNVVHGDNQVFFDRANDLQASAYVGAGNYRSDVLGQATTDFTVEAATGGLTFGSDLDITAADGTASLLASGGNVLSVTGTAALSSERAFNPDQPLAPAVTVFAGSGGDILVGEDLVLTATDIGFGGGNSTGGNIYVTANGGDVNVTGAIQADAWALDGFPVDESVSDAQGGRVYLRAMNSGNLSAGSVDAVVSATGGYTNVQGVSAGDAAGGEFLLHAQSGGQIAIAGTVNGDASAYGGDIFSNGESAGTGRGGSATIRAEGDGDINIGGTVWLSANAEGGTVSTPVTTTAAGGDGYGGSASFIASATGSSITTGDVFLSVNGHGGDGFAGGAGYGGGQVVAEVQAGFGAGIRTFAGSSMDLGQLNFNAVGSGGKASLGFGGGGGFAQGGTTFIQADTFASGDLLKVEVASSSITAGNAVLDASAVGGIGGVGFDNGIDPAIAAGAGGNAFGGTYTGADSTGGVHVIADNRGGQLDLGNVTMSAIATGGAGGVGGNAQMGGAGGVATGGTVSGGTYRPDLGNFDADAVAVYGDLFMDVSATGGNGGAGGAGGIAGAGGNATAGGYACGEDICGGVTFGARGDVTAGLLTMLARANGGTGSTGGNAVGGDTTLVVIGGGTLNSSGDLLLSTDAHGGYGAGGTGGTATGGWSGILVEDGSLTGGGRIGIESYGFGGDAGVGGTDGGAGTSGTTVLQITAAGSVATPGEVALIGNGEGGDGDANGGDAFGGTSTLTLDDGALSAGSLRVAGNGTGGTGGAAGGDATGGTATLAIGANGGDLDVIGATVVNAFAVAGAGLDNGGGAGGAGGFATGGDASFTTASELAIGAIVDVDMGNLTVNGAAEGGAGGDGADGGDAGDAIGGTATVDLGSGSVTMGTMTVRSNGFGGEGGVASSGTGGDGGDATGGTGTLNVGAGASLTALSYSNTNSGDAGIAGAGSTGGVGGAGVGGTGLATIDGSASFTQTANPNAGFIVTSFGGGGSGGTGGSGQGGSVDVQVNGTLSSAQFLQVTARAQGGNGNAGAGGAAQGGDATLTVNGSILNGTIVVATNTTGGNGTTSGGNASAGSSRLDVVGDVTAASATVDASAIGGNASAGDGGDSASGNASLFVAGGGNLVSGPVTVVTDATGGSGTTSGGEAVQQVEAGATLDVDVGGLANLGGTTLVTANSTGGAATTGSGGYAEGGFAEFSSQGTVTGSANLRILSAAIGGNGSTGGEALGGSSGLYANNGGTISLNSANLISSATGGDSSGANGAIATGGTSEIIASGAGSSITLANAAPFTAGPYSFESRYLASATGSGGQSGGGTGVGGTGTGGRATVRAEAGGMITLPTGAANLSQVVARGFGGDSTVDGGSGGQGSGSLAEVGADGGTLIAPNLLVSSYGQGGNSAATSLNISGGDGIGGDRNLFATNGGVLTIAANGGGPGGIGGNASGTGTGGDGVGGDARLDVDNGLVQLTGNVSVFSQTGGGTGAIGGNAGGGSAVISVINGGQIVDLVGTSTLNVSSGAIGGEGTVQGGSGAASTATLTVDAASSIVAGNVGAFSIGTGGVGPDGGSGGGGTAQMTIAGSLGAGAVTITASGTGGDGADSGGNGDGGFAQFIVASGGSADLASLSVGADGFGGNSASGFGGDATSGSAEIEVQGTFTAAGETFVSAEGEGGDGLLGGGNGFGGDAQLAALFGGTITLGTSTNVESEGTGGASGDGRGGDGVGGLSLVDANQGGVISANDLTVSSSGEGGSGVDGGFGTGGFPFEIFAGSFVEAIGAGSSITLTGLTTIESRGEAGEGSSSSGFGTGGYASLYAETASVDAADVLIDVTGFAPAGGTAAGGTAVVEGIDGTLAAGAVTAVANGTTEGGEVRINADTSSTGSTLTFTSLDATANGGTFAGDVLVDVAAGSIANLGSATLTANGGIPASGEDGIEVDIVGQLNATDLTLASTDDIQINTLLGGQIIVDGTLQADSAALITMSDDGGGGLVQATAIDLDGASVVFNGVASAADILFTVDGDYALTALPAASNGFAISAGGSVTADSNLTYGSNLVIDAGLDVATQGITAAGTLELTAGRDISTGNLTAGSDLNLEAVGDIGFADVDAGSFDFGAGGAVTGGNIVADTTVSGDADGAIALGDITVGPGPEPAGDFSVGLDSLTSISVGDVVSYGRVGFATQGTLTTGDIDAGSVVMMLIGGDITAGAITTDPGGTVYIGDDSMFAAAGGAPGNAGEDDFNAAQVLASAPVATGGAVTVGAVTTGTMRTAAGTNLTTGPVNADGAIALIAGGVLTTGDLVAGTTIATQSGGNLQIGNATAGTSVDLNSGGSLVTGVLDAPIVDLTVAGDFTTGDLFVDNSLSLAAGGNLTAGNIFAGGDLSLTAGLDLVTLDLDAAGNLTLNADGNITAGDLTAGGGIAAGAGGDLTVGNVISGFVPVGDVIGQAVVASGENVLLTAGGDLTAGTITSGEGISVTSTTGSITVGDMDAATTVVVDAGTDFTVAGVDAGTSASFTAGGLANFNGAVTAPTISVTSADINIAEAGSLGALGVTNLLTFNATGTGEVILGGDGTEASAGQYQLAEDGDIIADSVVFNAAGDIRILDAEIDGSQSSDGGVSHLMVNSEANVFVQGQVNFVDAAATDTLSINAGDSIHVVTDTGGISITDSSGGLSGALALTAHDIWVADQATLNQIAATNPSFAELEALLSINAGTVRPEGAIQAASLGITMLGSSFLVQNTGSDTELAGLTVGQGGLNIVNNGSEPATVILYGRQQNSDGSFVTGEAFFDQVEFGGDGGYVEGSNVNGCDVGGGCSPETPPTVGGPESILGPIGLMNDPKAASGNSSGNDEFAELLGEEEDSEDEEDEGEDDGKGGVDAGSALINTGPVSIETPVDEPVTSGADSPDGSL